MITVIYHRADFDGIFCREIARKFLGDEGVEYIGWDFADPSLAIPESGQIYVLDLPVDRVFGATTLAVDEGDLCFLTTEPPPRRLALHRLVWMDHHKSSIETHPAEIAGYRIDGVAACRLAWQWFIWMSGAKGDAPLPEMSAYVDRTVEEPLAVRLAGEYDIWDKRDPRAELFQHGLRSRDLNETMWMLLLAPPMAGGAGQKCASEITVEALLDAGEAIQYVREREYSEVIKLQGFTFQWEGLTFLGCNSHRLDIRSHLFADGIRPEHDALFGFTLLNGRWSVSMYAVPGREDLDLSELARKYGGGGHRNACGFITEDLPFLTVHDGAGQITAERRRQVGKEGWTARHDDAHDTGELVDAAVAYCMVYGTDTSDAIRRWPWAATEFNPGDRKRNLQKAGALLAAELDRLDRLAGTSGLAGTARPDA